MQFTVQGTITKANVKADSGGYYNKATTTLDLGLEVTVPKPKAAEGRDEWARYNAHNAERDWKLTQPKTYTKKQQKNHDENIDPENDPDGPAFCTHQQCPICADLEAADTATDDDDDDDDDDAPTLDPKGFKSPDDYIDALYARYLEQHRAEQSDAIAGAQTIGVLLQLLKQPLRLTLEPVQGGLLLLGDGQ